MVATKSRRKPLTKRTTPKTETKRREPAPLKNKTLTLTCPKCHGEFKSLLQLTGCILRCEDCYRRKV